MEVNDFTIETEDQLLDISKSVRKVSKRKLDIAFDIKFLSPEYVRGYSRQVKKTENINNIIRHVDE